MSTVDLFEREMFFVVVTVASLSFVLKKVDNLSILSTPHILRHAPFCPTLTYLATLQLVRSISFTNRGVS